MSFTVQTIVAPSQEPVSLSDAKDFLRIDAGDTSNDAVIAMLLSSARVWAEQYTRRRFMQQSLELLQDFFPGLAAYGGYPPGLTGDGNGAHEFFYQRLAFHLPYAPVTSVTSVKFTSQNGDVTVLDPATYIVDLASKPARITPLFGQTWPPLLFVPNAVSVAYLAGYGRSVTVSMGAASGILTGYTATPADIGSTASVPGAGPSGNSLNALIASVTGGVATLNTPSVGAVTDVTAIIGVPQGIRTAILLWTSIWFENRIYAGTQARYIPSAVETLLFPYRDLSRA